MKSGTTRQISKVTFLAVAVLASCFAAGTASAQAGFQGKFTLPYEVRWGQAVLSPGDYTVSMNDPASAANAVIRDAKSHRIVAQLMFSITENAGQGGSALLVGSRGQQRVVYSFRAAELGTTFVSDPSLAHGRAAREEARQARAIPLLQAKN
jgi:hypothetical protein